MIPFIQVTNPEENIFFHQVLHRYRHAPKTEKKIEPGNVLSKRRGSFAARLPSLWPDNPLSKGHPMSLKQGLEL